MTKPQDVQVTVKFQIPMGLEGEYDLTRVEDSVREQCVDGVFLDYWGVKIASIDVERIDRPNLVRCEEE